MAPPLRMGPFALRLPEASCLVNASATHTLQDLALLNGFVFLYPISTTQYIRNLRHPKTAQAKATLRYAQGS